MARRYFSLLAPLFILLWVAGTNHCAIETLFSSGTPSTQGQCASHPDSSPDSHHEGQPCVSKAMLGSDKASFETAKIDPQSALPLLHLAQALIEGLQDNSHERNDYTYTFALDTHEGILTSLSIASNAPPFTA